MGHTFGNLKVSDSLPLVHGYEPSADPTSTTEINDKIFFAVPKSLEQ